jgi:hypothetical protein
MRTPCPPKPEPQRIPEDTPLTQYLAVWYNSPESIGPKFSATFTKAVTDKGLFFTVTEKVDLGSMRKNSLGLLYMEDDSVVACATWRSLGTFTPYEGSTVQLHPLTPTETKP